MHNKERSITFLYDIISNIMVIQDCIKKLVDKIDLAQEESEKAMDEIMSGIATPSQISSLITALRMKGETPEEITGFSCVMRDHAVRLDLKSKYFVDTCGTGGDASNTFNISTISAFVAAGAGAVVAKHGNRSVSSKCGSADLLEALGVKIDIAPEKVAKCIDQIGIGFIFAPLFHQAMKFAAPTRKEIGIRTIFNILGPVSNPANTKGQLLGVYSPNLTEVMAQVLKNQGCEEAIIVHGMDQIDEISISEKTKVSHLKNGNILNYFIEPEDFNLKKSPKKSVLGGDVQENAAIAQGVLDGTIKGSKRDIVILNSAAVLIVGHVAHDFYDGIKIAEKSIDSGAALGKLEELKRFTCQ